MRLYNPNDPQDELLLLNFWSHLVESNELLTVFNEAYTRVSEFFLAFRQDVLLIETDERGIWGAFWFDRSPLAGAFFSLWLRADRRHSRHSLESISAAIGFGFHDLKFRALLVVTREPGIAKMHWRYGFQKLGLVPGLYFGDTAIVSYLTDDMFDAIATETSESAELPAPASNGTGI